MHPITVLKPVGPGGELQKVRVIPGDQAAKASWKRMESGDAFFDGVGGREALCGRCRQVFFTLATVLPPNCPACKRVVEKEKQAERVEKANRVPSWKLKRQAEMEKKWSKKAPCDICEKPIPRTMHYNSLRCSVACQEIADQRYRDQVNAERQAARRAKKGPCDVCGKVIPPKRAQRFKRCSAPCDEKAFARTQQEHNRKRREKRKGGG